MNLKRIIGILVCIAGVVLILFASYINNQVAAGKEQVASGQKKVDQGKTLFGLNPYTKAVGQKVIFDSADQKIKAGQEEIANYETLAGRLQIGGIVLIVAGLGIIFIPSRKRR